MELWFEWEGNNEEHLSFDDSDRFEEDSLCSWVSEPESICGNWRGWKRNSQNGVQLDSDHGEGKVETLIEISARTVAKHLPFETVERAYPQIPEQLQLRIAFWSFPPFEEDIRLYSCLANGSPDKFLEGEQLLKVQAVKDALQIGFHLSATVHQPHGICQSKGTYNVAVTFDRGRITSCNCTCDQTVTWCSHVIALCLFRIHFPNLVCLRAPVSEYLSRLRRDQLQKFAQYLISELPQQLLPTAQRLLDELLSSQESAINSLPGAPDPTAGPSAADHSKWYLDESALHENIKKMLVRFCGPSPLVFSDVNALYLANTAPPTAAEWSNLLRPLRGREPEGMWNLLSIVRELFRRGDMNAVNLLIILTEECLANDQVLIWWFDSRSQASGNSSSHNHSNGYRGNTNAASTEATKHACAGFCDELVTLWRLAALNPKLLDDEREEIKNQLQEWHQKAVEKGRTGRGSTHVIPPTAVSCFPGFLTAIEACSLNWRKLELGIVPQEKSQQVQLPMTLRCARMYCPESIKDTESDNIMAPPESERESQGANEETTSSSVDNDCTPIPVQDIDEGLEILCARTEALHVHGYHSVAGKLAVKLAENILSDSSKLSTSGGTRNSNRGAFTNTILVKAAFLCNVLAEDLHCHHLAFRVGMLGLEMPRQPAKSKALEVKLLNQESDLVSLLKRLPLGQAELAVVREKAELLCHGQLRRGGAVLPIMMASFIFDVLCPCNSESSHAKRQVTGKLCTTTKEDEELGFKAALHAIGMKGNALENRYPMLCEGTRRQRGDLALTLLFHCRDDTSRIRQIMDVLLDKNRYDLPSVTGTSQAKKKVERCDSQENKSEGREMSSNSGVKNRASLGVPNRRGSSDQNSSSTSDSGTDSSSKDSSGVDRCKPRGACVRPSPQRAAALSVDDESGSSSGVDTDSIPVPVRVVDIHQADLQKGVRTAGVPDRDMIRVDESPREAFHASVPTQNDAPVEDASAVDPHSTQDPNVDIQSQEELVEKDLYTNTSVLCIKEPTTSVTDVMECTQDVPSRNAKDDNTSTSLDKESCHAKPVDPAVSSVLIESIPQNTGPVENVPQDPVKDASHLSGPAVNAPNVCDPVEDAPGDCGDFPPLAPSQCVNPDHPGPSTSGLDANILRLDESPDSSNELPTTPSTESVATTCFSDARSAISVNKIRASQDFSSEGDVSDIEADFEDSQQEVSSYHMPSRSLLNAGEKKDVNISHSVAGVEDEASSSPNDMLQSDSSAAACPAPDDECYNEGATASADAAVAPLEAVEEQSSESGARGSTSASAEDTDRSRRRNRNRGRRRARMGKSARYQATEAEAHFMFELAKTVLTKSGGSNSTSVFTQAATSDTQSGPDRVLQLCAFEIGLFALGLHNLTSPNWLSRTYSSHVSWISGQAMEIGHQAITLLLERWEGNLTPSEVASIADRASRSNDRAMVRAAAELGLSCLHMATTLNPVEIQRALSQCREEDSQLLDQACQAVESAARGGGVYPEVLFDVAKHWFHLHEINQTSNGTAASRPAKSESRSRSVLGRSSQSTASSSHSSLVSPFESQLPQFTVPPSYSSIPPPLYTTPEQYVQQQMHQQVHQMMGHYPGYLSGGSSGYRSGSQSHYSYPFSRSLTGTQFSLSGAYAGLTPPPYQTTSSASSSSNQHLNRLPTGQQGTQVSYYLNSAYRVGMLALEFLSRRTSDDRPNVKFSRNPSCSDDIRWLCTLSAKLGTSHLQRFCVAALNAVVSPFVLHDLALEAARHMARSNPAQLAANLRSPTISPLVQKSLTMYAQCIHYNLINITQSEYDEFVELLRHARGAFCMAPGGMTQFNELLQSIRWGHSKKKELWQMIMTGLAKA